MNLLTDPLFRVETSEGLKLIDLPGLLMALGQDRVLSLPGLQRHQEDAFHVFLCYLSGAVLSREGIEEPEQDVTFWRETIRRLNLAHGCADDALWTLVVEDPTRPAFMQQPVPKKEDFKGFKLKAETPDALDLLPTAKNHDVKANRSSKPQYEDWIYALISLQTMSGFFGQGNYGIARMNGGFGSRPVVGLRYDDNLGGRWKDDVKRLLKARSGLLDGPWGYRADGLVLTWVPPWDLKSSISLSTLDPFFIEIARPLRLLEKGNRIYGWGTSSKQARIAAKGTNGRIGDPWIPINQKKEAALTVSSTGFTPELLRNLIFEDGFIPSAMQLPDTGREGEACHFTASVLVRGNGTTDGFHHAEIPIPSHVALRLFRRGPERDRLGDLSKRALNDAGQMQKKVLWPALVSLLQAGPEKLNFDKREISAWLKRSTNDFSKAWAADFFSWLWRTLGQPDDDAPRLEWLRSLRVKAEDALRKAVDRFPSRHRRLFRARVRAENLFVGSLNKQFPEVKEARHGSTKIG